MCSILKSKSEGIIKYTGPIFRPPLEANTVLLQVTVVCAHNKCTYCTMYQSVAFHLETMDQIEKDLQEIKKIYGKIKRIFLINGDAFVLSPRRLILISDKIIEYFPDMEVITMYASIRNIRGKSDKELMMLKKARINDLWIGMETGHPNTLKAINKGYDLDEAKYQLSRLNRTGIRHNGIYLLGISGRGKGIENAKRTAELINITKPQLVGVTSLGLFEGSQLTEDTKNGLFIQATEKEILKEEKCLLENIQINIPFFGSHPTNAANISGILPDQKQKLIDLIDETIDFCDDEFLNNSVSRTSL